MVRQFSVVLLALVNESATYAVWAQQECDLDFITGETLGFLHNFIYFGSEIYMYLSQRIKVNVGLMIMINCLKSYFFRLE